MRKTQNCCSIFVAAMVFFVLTSPALGADPPQPQRRPPAAPTVGVVQGTASAVKPAPVIPSVPLIGPALASNDERLQRIFAGEAPQSTADLMAMQDRLQKLTSKLSAVTVGVRLRNGMGSGVIISEDGYVMTAGHVVDRPGQDVTIFLPDGKRLSAKTLGADYGMDSGLIKITEPGKWPYAPLGDSTRLRTGQWCIATGHPGGFDKDRSPPLRFGRIVELSSKMIVTDCPLVGGDSGGPLFDTDGRVIGINSRIGNELYSNIHVPTATFRSNWTKLAQGEAWGGRRPNGPFIGVIADRSAAAATVADVVEGSPADEAGLKTGDVVLSFAGVPTPTFEALISAVARKEPGERARLEIRRDGTTMELDLVVGRYGG